MTAFGLLVETLSVHQEGDEVEVKEEEREEEEESEEMRSTSKPPLFESPKLAMSAMIASFEMEFEDETEIVFEIENEISAETESERWTV